ncbi:MAG: cadmium-translocating P-type ATPase [Oscillospiraceae bacterium]|nr:cadmium-translocating P-type ATPase [Oscillospiraceae bacterium]
MSKKQRKMLLRIVIAAVLFVPLLVLELTGVSEEWAWYIALPVHLVPYLIVGYDVLRKAARNICHGRIFDENFLMCIATLGAIAVGEYPEAVEVMLFFQIGELLQAIAVRRSRRSVSDLMDIRPDYANVERDGELLRVDPGDVQIGEIILVKPGEKVPLDGVVIEGSSNLDTAALTGESLPRGVAAGSELISGCVNMSGALKARVTKPYGESTVAKILDLVENASSAKAKSEGFITRFAKYYTPAVVLLALLLAVVPPVFLGDFPKWIRLALTCLVVSCPCALVISVPLTFFAGIGGAAREGILVKGANRLEELAKVQTVVFDKTGTLTSGRFTVTVVHPDRMAEEELLYLAAAAECYSDHPISLSLKQAYKKEIDRTKVASVEEIAGRGVRAVIDGKTVLVGNERLMLDHKIVPTECCHAEHRGTLVHVAVNGVYAGHVEICDELKPDAAETIRLLRPRKTVILTGDHASVGEDVAARLGVDEVHCDLLPADKVMKVEALLQSKPASSALAFVGDGINDAPVLSRADVGIAMGALGSDAAIEAADIVLMDDKPSKVTTAIRASRRTLRIVRENVVFSLAVKVGVLIAEIIMTSLGSNSDMTLAAFADVGVLVLAVLNATRALRVK